MQHFDMRTSSQLCERAVHARRVDVQMLQVYSTRLPTVDLGEDFRAAGKPSLQVCYLLHALGSGEHYNSVAPISMSLDEGPFAEHHTVTTITA
jgi:hypothetical protein